MVSVVVTFFSVYNFAQIIYCYYCSKGLLRHFFVQFVIYMSVAFVKFVGHTQAQELAGLNFCLSTEFKSVSYT